MQKFNHVVKGLDPVANAFAGTVYSDIISLAKWNHIQFIIYKGVGTTGTSQITVEACDDISASTTDAVPFIYQACVGTDVYAEVVKATITGFLTTAGSSQLYKIDVDAEKLNDSGYQFVRLACVESEASAVLGGILAILTEGKYQRSIPDTVLE